MIAFFSLTLFLNAFLLFVIQPMAAKELLPLVGGAPAVWLVCMLFFQATLLFGYTLAWLAPRFLGFKLAAMAYVALFAAATISLMFLERDQSVPPTSDTPIFWLLQRLIGSLGLPLLALSAGAPILQGMFARTSHSAASDPYFLYAASNLGSILALLSYPFAIETWLTLDEQRTIWQIGIYFVLALILLCTAFTWQGRGVVISAAALAKVTTNKCSPISRHAMPLRWTLLAFVPSSMLLGVTAHLTTDLAPVPLLWVLPLVIYLLTFVLTFARRPPVPHAWMVRVLPVAVIATTLAWLVEATEPLLVIVGGLLFLLFNVCMVCHGELARTRPATPQLGAFYFFLALGGVLGGVFNGVIAPMVFPGLFEYPLAIVLACLLAPPAWGKLGAGSAIGDFGWPAGLAIVTVAFVHFEARFVAVAFGLALVACYLLAGRPRRFSLGIACLFLAGLAHEGAHGKTIYRERDFFGIHRVTLSEDGLAHLLVHGNTVHGMQWIDPTRSKEALTYYHAHGPIGAVFAFLRESNDTRPVAVVGLGTGALASYAQAGQEFTFYEIDPAVIKIAKDPQLFTFLRDCPTTPSIVQGDGRLALGQAPKEQYALIVIDAFSSDAIPLHLLTREALAIYRGKLAKDGLLAFHVSNRYLDLAPVLGDMAGDAGMTCLFRHDPENNQETGLYASQWILLAERKRYLPNSALWIPLNPRAGVQVWTDDYCNLAGALRWK